MTEKNSIPLNFNDCLPEIQKRLSGKTLLLFLDYDGTLTPIVDTPDLAILGDDMRETLRCVAKKITTSIVSGRATDDVKAKVQLPGLFYAGSHGFEIVDPQGHITVNEQAGKIRGTIDEVHAKLSQRLKDIPGALVEHVKYTISSHYRLVAEKDFPVVKAAVESILKEYPGLRVTHGKKVFEIRPKIDWDKGKAVGWILKCLRHDPQNNICVYIGDDTTDEDAFRFIQDTGFGILVSDRPRPSGADYLIQDTAQIKDVLQLFLRITGTPS